MKVRCPDSPDINDVIGCGAIFEAEPDDEGYFDCPECGLFFDATHPHSNEVDGDAFLAALDEQRAPGVVFVLRDPDASNMIETFGLGNPTVIDIDLGRADLYDDEEWSMWIESHRESCAALTDPRARAWYERVLADVAEQFHHVDELDPEREGQDDAAPGA